MFDVDCTMIVVAMNKFQYYHGIYEDGGWGRIWK